MLVVGDDHHYAMSRKVAESYAQSTHKCLSMQPGSQKEMQIDFDDDESPQQTEQGHSAMPDTVKQPRMQVYPNHAKSHNDIT